MRSNIVPCPGIQGKQPGGIGAATSATGTATGWPIQPTAQSCRLTLHRSRGLPLPFVKVAFSLFPDEHYAHSAHRSFLRTLVMEAPGLLSRGRLHQGSGLRAVGDLAYDLQSGGLGKLAWLANRDQERPRAANDAVAKVQVQLRDFPGAGGPLQ